MGTVSFNYKVLEYTPVQGYHMVEKHVENQPTLKTIFADGNGPLYDGKFTTMEGSSYTYPYTGFIGTYGNSIIRYTESTVEGIKTSLFGKGIGNGFKYFENNNSEVNKFSEKIILPRDTSLYPLDVLETDTVKVTVQSVVKNSASRYTGYVSGEWEGTLIFRKEFTSEELNDFISKIYVRVYDKTLDTYFDKELYCLNAAGDAARFGDNTAKLIITGLFLEDYNPKYVCNSVSNSNYVNSLTDDNDMLQYTNEEIGYDSNPGTISCLMFAYQSNRYSYNNGYDEFFSDAFIDTYKAENLYDLMYDNNSEYSLDNTKSEWPGVSKSVEYLNAGADITDPTFPSDCKYATQTQYTFMLNYINLYQLEVNAKLDNGKYHIGNCIANYTVPEPEPVPEPLEPGNKRKPGDPYDFEIPDSPIAPQPSIPQEQDNDVIKDLDIDESGRSFDNDYDNWKEKESETINGFNNFDFTTYAEVSSNFFLYVCNQENLIHFRDILTRTCGSRIYTLINQIMGNLDPKEIIAKVLEFPIKIPALSGYQIDLHDRVPAFGRLFTTPLLRIPRPISNLSTAAVGLLLGITEDEATAGIADGIVQVPTHVIDRKCDIQYLETTNTRLYKLEFGTKTIKRIFGNSLDFDDVKYSIYIAQLGHIELDPRLLFRTSSGEETDTCELSINGILDIESGDLLISILANDDLIHQGSINIAVERALYGDDIAAAIRGISEGVVSIAAGVSQIIGTTSYTSTKSRDTGNRDETNWGVDTGYSTNTHESTSRSLSSNESHDINNYETLHSSQNGWNDPNTQVRMAGVRTDSWNKGNKEYSNVGQNSRNGSEWNYSTNDSKHEYQRGTSSLSILSNAGSQAVTSASPYGGVTSVIKGIGKIMGSACKSTNWTQGQVGGTSKLYTQILPVLIIDTPDVIVPYRNLNYETEWEFDYDYIKENGLPASTLKVGIGFNRYNNISRINNKWCGYITLNELDMLKTALLTGFYIRERTNIYRTPQQIYGVYKDKIIWDSQNETTNLYVGNTDYISLFSINTEYVDYVDKLYLQDAYTSLGDITYCFKCFVYNDQKVESPIIDVACDYYQYQNHALYNGRIYRIARVEYLPGSINRLYLVEDVLATFFNSVDIYGIIDRSSSYYNSDIMEQFPMSSFRCVKKEVYDDLEYLFKDQDDKATHSFVCLIPSEMMDPTKVNPSDTTYSVMRFNDTINKPFPT